jgi:hypothetical protein
MSVPSVYEVGNGNHFRECENGFYGDSPGRTCVYIGKELFRTLWNSSWNKDKFVKWKGRTEKQLFYSLLLNTYVTFRRTDN